MSLRLTLSYPFDKWYGLDWIYAFRPAALAILSGASPYINNPFGVYSPPWTFLPLIPVALLPGFVGAILISILNIACAGFVVYRLSASLPLTILFVLSPLVLNVVYLGNMDGILLLGFILPPPIGLFFLLAKPQIGAAVAVFWLIEAWRIGRVRKMIEWFAPVTCALIVSFVLYGFYFKSASDLLSVNRNASLFPWSIPIGVILIAWSIYHRRRNTSIAASPFLAPYVTPPGWAVVPLAALPNHADAFIVLLALMSAVLYLH